MSQYNLLFSHSLGKLSPVPLPSLRTVPDWMWLPVAFGYERAFFDVRVFNPYAPSNRQPLATCYRKHENIKKRAYEQRVKLSTAPSLHLSCHSLEVWEKLPLFVTRGLPPCSPPNMTSPTVPPLPGSDVLSLFPSYDHPSGVLEVLDLLLAAQ